MHGYSIIEQLIVISIISILLVISYLSITDYIENAKLQNFQNILLSDLEFVKLNSIRRQPHGIFIYNDRYEIRKLIDENNNFIRDSAEGTDLISGINPIISVPNNIYLAWNGCSGNVELWFDRKGIPRCKNWGLGMGTIKLFNNKISRQIVINKNGRFKVAVGNKIIE